MSAAAKPSPQQARALLGLGPDAAQDEIAQAFRAAAKLAHPDRPGGDAERFRQILEAYRALQAKPGLPATIPTTSDPGFIGYVEIGAMLALEGGEAEATLAYGRRGTAKIPIGARHGESLYVDGERITVRIVAEPAIQVRGDDVWISAKVDGRALLEGGRAIIVTPFGAKRLWISRAAADRRLVRLEGRGLPARGAYAAGSLFIRLVANADPAESPVRAQLKKFAAAWAA
jgi:curved DNA-binding protein